MKKLIIISGIVLTALSLNSCQDNFFDRSISELIIG